jgi:hypothetical protein
MPESVISVQAFLSDIESVADAALASELTSKFGDIQVEVLDNVAPNARQFRIALPQETGAAAIASPYQIKVFAAPSEAGSKGELDAFVAANPTYFVSQVQYDYTFQAPNQSERCIFFVVYNTNLAAGIQNWAGAPASGSGGGGGAGDGDFTWEFDADITDTDPGAGKYKFNNADPALATFIYFDDITADGLDVQNFLAAIGTGARITAEQLSLPTSIAIFVTTGVTVDGTGYWKVPVTNEAVGATAFAAGEDCGLNFIPAAAVTPPGGSDTEVQYNNAGAFGGDADLTFDHAVSKSLKNAGVEVVAGLDWTAGGAIATQSWNDVVYGNGLYVAVSISGTGTRVSTSTDGVLWTTRTSAADNAWVGVTFGNGLFVAVANTGTLNRIMTSPDGINWTIRSTPVDNDWRSVTFGNGLFVAVSATGTGDRVMTSSDGITWVTRVSAEDNFWTDVTFGDGLFVAVASSGTNRVMRSADGITWLTSIAATQRSWQAITYGNGLFVASSITGVADRIMTSPDAITWTSRTSVSDLSWQSIIYGNGLFVALSNTATTVAAMTSADAITWTLRTTPSTDTWLGIAFGNNRFVAVAAGGGGSRTMISGAIDANIENGSPNTHVAQQTFKNDIVKASPGHFVQTAIQTIANTVVETTLIGAGSGSLALPADFWTVGKALKIVMHGQVDDTGTPTVELRLKLGATTILDSGAITFTNLSAPEEFRVECMLICTAEGVGGAMSGSIWFTYDTTTGSSPINGLDIVPVVGVAYDTTAAGDVDLTFEWGAADVANTITSALTMVDTLVPVE